MPEAGTYRFPLTRKRRWPLFAGIAFFLGFPAALLLGGVLADDQSLLGAGGIVAALMSPFALYLGWSLLRPVLVLSPSGVYLRGLGGAGEVTVAWDQVESLCLDAGAEGLVLKAPLESRFTRRQRNWAGVRINGAPITPENKLDEIAQCRFIPIDAFAAWFEEGRLREAFAAFAPHLLTGFESARTQALKPKPRDRKALAWVLGLTALYVVAVIWLAHSDFEISPGWASAGRWVWKALFLAVALGMVAVVWSNLLSVRRFLAERQWGMALFWFIAGLVQFGVALLALAEVLS